jgi:hypothetical protein
MEQKLIDAAALLGVGLIVGGAAVIHWPSALIVAGVFLLFAAVKATTARKQRLAEKEQNYGDD